MKKNNKGFTMAELLIVVAIIVVLMGVAFIAVQNYQRSSTRLEFDGIAKEIFIAAQNHLTTAESQGYVQLTGESGDQTSEVLAKKLGTKGGSSFDTKDERYFVYSAVNTYSTDPQKAESVLDLMLPFGAIDETVRAGGSYIIRYQPSSGRVLDVFYSLPGRSSLLTVTGVELTDGDYAPLMTGYRDNTKTREHYTKGDNTGVVGWYGGEEGLPTGSRLKAPEIIVHNEELLWVEVTDNNNGNGSLKLIVTGVTSGAQTSFETSDTSSRVKVPGNSVGNSFNVILDDITASGMHFADLTGDNADGAGNKKSFIPGEDIIIEAVAYSNSAITNVAYSGQKRTNSLFAEIKKETEATTEETTTEYVALVENFRHFENLDQTISGFSYNGAIKKENEEAYETISKARQIKNLNWKESSTEDQTEKPDSFIEAVIYIYNNSVSSISIYNNSDPNNQAVATNNCLYPISPQYKLEYDGKSNNVNHKISNVVVSNSENAGLFGSIEVPESEIKNLELIDFTVQGSVNAGALAGAISDSAGANTSVSNVLVRNSAEKDSSFSDTKNNKNNITAAVSAGGLIGSMSGGSVTGCAAAVYVSGGTNAGGLIGKAVSGTVTACYSGGHTDGSGTGTASYFEGGKPEYVNNELTKGIYNVVSESGTAGGLIGDAGSAEISCSYSTCSAKGGKNVGGLIGTGNGSVTRCYATGLVNGGSEAATGAFAGDFTGTISTEVGQESYYFQIINELHNADKTISYLPPVGNETESKDVKALDETANSYDKFVGAPKSSTEGGKGWEKSVPFDKDLETFYQGLYPLRTVTQLGASLPAAEQGQPDWFIKTHYGDWPAPEIFVINEGTGSGSGEAGG